MSPPAENAFPTPVVTTARTSSSAVSVRQIVAKAWCTDSSTALNASGRLMLTTCTAPRFSTSRDGAYSSYPGSVAISEVVMNLPSVLVAGKDGDGRYRSGATNVVRQSNSRAVDLVLGLAPQLVEQFVALRDTGGARWVTLGFQSAAGVDRNRTSHIVFPALDDLVRLEPVRESEIFVADQLDAGEAIVHLGDVDVTWGQPGHRHRRLGGLHRRREGRH